MKVGAEELSKALRFVKQPTDGFEPHPGMVLVERTARGLRVATDGGVCWLSALIPGPSGHGAAVVRRNDLAKLMAPKSEVDIEISDGGEAGVNRGVAVLLFQDSTKRPTLVTLFDQEADNMRADAPIAKEVVKLDCAAMAEVASVASNDTVRPVLCQVCVTKTAVVATDSYRVHLRRVSSQCPDMLIPAVAARHMAQLVDPVIHVNMEDRFLVASDATHTVLAYLLNPPDHYPNYASVVPDDVGPYFIRFGPDLENAMKALQREVPKSNAVFRPRVGGLTVSVKEYLVDQARHGKTKKPRVTKAWSMEIGGAMNIDKVGFNPKFVVDLFAGAESRELRGTDPLEPWVLAEDAPGGERVRVLMPVRV